MFRLLPWSSSVVGGNKVTAVEDVKVLATAATPERRSPVMEPLGLHQHKLKRKRADSVREVEGVAVHVKEQSSRLTAGVTSFTDARNEDAAKHYKNGISQPSTPGGGSSSMASQVSSVSPYALNQRKPITKNNYTSDSNAVIQDNNRKNDRDNTPAMEKSQATSAKLSVKTKMVDQDTLRQTIESQLSLEILLKHDELRLIDQEIAKCQVALEQLRRCAEIPYPVSNITGPSEAVSSGLGASTVPSQSTGRLPISPAPWGVADGPYARHYARWLLPDPRFDGGEPEPMIAPPTVGAGKSILEGRTTRASWAEAGGATPTGPSRAQRSSAGSKLQALSAGYPPPKDKAGPMIIKRKSDGQYVRLVCIDCRRDNFSSTQGFINHCRIAHNRNFASHDAAAVASGEPVDVDEAGMVIGKDNDTPNSGPPGYVHPLIRSAFVDAGKSTTRSKPQAQKASTQPTGGTQEPTPKPTRSPASNDTLNFSFKGSPQTPHLSALMQRRGLGLDLLNLVDDALTKTDIDMYSSDEETGDEAEENATKDTKSSVPARSSRLPARTVASPSHSQRPESRKGADKGSRKPHSSATPQATPGPFRSSYHPPLGHDAELADVPALDLSPNAPESNQAPSLVSDDGDCGMRSDSESLPSPNTNEPPGRDAAFDSIQVQDDESTAPTDSKPVPAHGKHRPAPMPAHPAAPPLKKQKLAKPKQVPNTFPENNVQPKRVTFVTPITATAPTPPKKASTKKQRRR